MWRHGYLIHSMHIFIMLGKAYWFNIAFPIICKSPRNRLKATRPSPSCGWGLGRDYTCSCKVVLSVLATTRVSGISRHCFRQGQMLLTIVGYPLALRSKKADRGRVSRNIGLQHNSWTQSFQANPHKFSLLAEYVTVFSGWTDAP